VQPQPGIFALGTPEHCFVELDLATGASPSVLVSALARLSGPETTISGVSFVVGFRPELWESVSDANAAAGARSFQEIRGPELTMPATQHDAWFWVAGGARDVVFDSTVRVLDAIGGCATVGSELGGWLYQHSRDLTGFIDGTENPSMTEASSVAVDGDGSSVLLYQKWRHLPSWRQLGVGEQERVIGRTKADSVELDDAEMPQDSHVSRNVVEEGGEELAIYRRNVAYGGPTDHGTVFVGFCASQHPLETMLRRMAGVGDGVRDALTRYTTPLSGAYYVVPSVDVLRGFAEAG
jgi:putative iron-dependent peroxidase